MAINCFTDFITLDLVCEATTPRSGLRVTQLPEIKFLTFESITDQDNVGIEGVWNEIYARALVRFEGDVRRRMHGKFSQSSVVEGAFTGKYKDLWTATTAGAEFRGVLIKVDGSPFIDLNLASIRFYSGSANAINFFVYDAQSGLLLDTIASTVVIGHNIIQVDTSYAVGGRNSEYFICYDATAQTSAETTLSGWEDSCNSCTCSNPGEVLTIRGASVGTGQAVIESNMSLSNDTHGLIAVVNAQCGVGNFICANRDLFTEVFWYACGIETLLELKNTERLNPYTLHRGMEQADRALYGVRTEFNRETPGLTDSYGMLLDDILENVRFTEDGICFECVSLSQMKSTV